MSRSIKTTIAANALDVKGYHGAWTCLGKIRGWPLAGYGSTIAESVFAWLTKKEAVEKTLFKPTRHA